MLVLPAASLAYLLVGSSQLQEAARNNCLSEFYYGTYGDESVFIPNQECFNKLHMDFASTGTSMVPLGSRPWDNSMLVWLHRAAVDDSITTESSQQELYDFLVGFATSPQFQDDKGQSILVAPDSHTGTILDNPYMGSSTALLRMSPHILSQFDANLPRFWKYTILSDTPFSMIPVPQPAVDKVQRIIDSVKFDPVIASIVNGISVPQMKEDIRYLTGEDPKSEIISRHSFSNGIRIAADWIKGVMESTGATCELKPFIRGFGPNIICSYPSIENTDETVLLSAHYDSRGSFGSVRAPGGDDDGSGTTAVIAMARTIARKGISFKKNVQLCLFAGEEQGLLGSRAYAREMRAKNADLTLMIQADMLAYHVPGEPPQLGLPDLIGTPEVAYLVSNISSIYSPELVVGPTPACCSDHQSFHEQGFPGTQVFERAGPIVDPMYHNSGDVSDRPGYDLDQVKSIAKVQFATLLHSAGFELSKKESS